MNGTTPASSFVRTFPRLLIGIAVLTVGLLWTLDNMNIVESERITDWWPVVLIAIGGVRFLDPVANKIPSVLLVGFGFAFLLDNLGVWDFDLGDLIPLLIAGLGVKLVLDALRRRSAPVVAATDDHDSVVNSFAMMASVQRRSLSTDFRGGDANAIMGGVELDLRGADIGAGKQAVLDTFALWGGIEIRVPQTWRVVNEVFPLMGGFEDVTVAPQSGPVLIVRGTAIMGGVKVKN
ncbi:MAG TPA: DUF5668 domain-containing protein [Thermoanaerobaculia bacterium]|jgi:hypothetical protein